MQKPASNKAILDPIETKESKAEPTAQQGEVYLFGRHGRRPGAAIRAMSLEEAQRLYYETIKPIDE